MKKKCVLKNLYISFLAFAGLPKKTTQVLIYKKTWLSLALSLKSEGCEGLTDMTDISVDAALVFFAVKTGQTGLNS